MSSVTKMTFLSCINPAGTLLPNASNKRTSTCPTMLWPAGGQRGHLPQRDEERVCGCSPAPTEPPNTCVSCSFAGAAGTKPLSRRNERQSSDLSPFRDPSGRAGRRGPGASVPSCVCVLTATSGEDARQVRVVPVSPCPRRAEAGDSKPDFIAAV